jgi:ATP-dependent RNA helicase MSS116
MYMFICLFIYRLLDMGFKRDLDKITSYLSVAQKGKGGSDNVPEGQPSRPRQTLLFSATFSTEVIEIASATLRKGYSYIDTVGEQAEQTHAHVSQNIMPVPVGQQIRALSMILEQQMNSNPNYKIMVFFPTARQTGYMAQLFNSVGIECLEIHSRKSQSQRTRTSEQFRLAKKGIMFSSDVTARGMDYPDVTLVLQMGLTNKEQYTHRLGRTARAGKEGSGLLLCAPFETNALKNELRYFPMATVCTIGYLHIYVYIYTYMYIYNTCTHIHKYVGKCL